MKNRTARQERHSGCWKGHWVRIAVILPWLLAAALLVSCKDRFFDNPFDPGSTNYVGQGVSTDLDGNGIADALEPELVFLQGGCFQMGKGDSSVNPVVDSIIDEDERPQHYVCIDSFFAAVTEVTFGQYRAVFPEKLSGTQDDSLPAVNVTWYDAVEYCNRLSELHGYEPAYAGWGQYININYLKNGFRLLSEAEWEYACGADSGDWYAWGNAETDADKYAWFDENSSGRAHRVGGRLPNRFGLYDISGNAWEWVNDWYGDYTEQVRNPYGPIHGSLKVMRGGSWHFYGKALRVSNRRSLAPGKVASDAGFRVGRSAR